MRKIICVLLAIGLLTAVSLPASAGGRGGHYYGRGGYYHGHSGGNAGSFFAGLVGGAILGAILSNTPPTAYYEPPPPAYVPPVRVWVPGHHETRYEREWVPGHWDRDMWIPGHYENVRVDAWVPGRWEERG